LTASQAKGRPTEAETQAAVATLLRWSGEDPDREGLKETPARVARAFLEYTAGYAQDPMAMLRTTFSEVEGYDEIILLKDIPFVSMCEHHLAPITGVAHVAYLPGKRVVGISKLARVVEAYARRLQIQERLTSQIAAAIQGVLNPNGVAVILSAEHGCISCRGVNRPGIRMVTSRLLGAFRDDPRSRAELMTLIGGAADG